MNYKKLQSKIKKHKKIITRVLLGVFLAFGAFGVFAWWQVYVPKSKSYTAAIVYAAQKGMGDEEIAKDLQDQGIIKSNLFFQIYVNLIGKHANLQAGSYKLSSSMSMAQIAKKLIAGDVIKDKLIYLKDGTLKTLPSILKVKIFIQRQIFLL